MAKTYVYVYTVKNSKHGEVTWRCVMRDHPIQCWSGDYQPLHQCKLHSCIQLLNVSRNVRCSHNYSPKRPFTVSNVDRSLQFQPGRIFSDRINRAHALRLTCWTDRMV